MNMYKVFQAIFFTIENINIRYGLKEWIVNKWNF